MDFDFSAEQNVLRDAVRQFVAREVPREYARRCERDGRPPFEAFRKLAETGWLGLGLPEEYGGGGDFVDVVILLEELARASGGLAATVGRTAIYAGQTILRCGTPEQRDEYLPRIVAGRFFLSIGMTEPGAGSDAAAIVTRAAVDGDGFVVNGQKLYCTGADYADRILLSARTDPGRERHAGISTLLVDPKLPGIEIHPIETLGMRDNPTYSVFLEDVRVPASELLGELHDGWAVITGHLERERIGQAGRALGAMQAVMDEASRHATQREQFGRPLWRFQAIQHKLADMATDIHLARLAVYNAAWTIARGRPCSMEASMTKLFVTEAYRRVADHGLQIMGSYGYSMESDVQRHFCDARLGTIGAGTSEIQRNVLGTMIGKGWQSR